jgi:hypothetical protein
MAKCGHQRAAPSEEPDLPERRQVGKAYVQRSGLSNCAVLRAMDSRA